MTLYVIGIANSFQHGEQIVLVFNMCLFMMYNQDLKEISRSITSFLLIFRPTFLYDC